MMDGKTQNMQGFLADMPVIIVEYAMPYGYGLSVEHLLTKVTCPAVSTDASTKEETHHGSRRDPEHSGLLVGQPSHHRRAYDAIRILSQCRRSLDKGDLSRCEHRD